MKVFTISDFKAKCIRILKSVGRSRDPVVVTLRGKPIAQVMPIGIGQGKRTLGGLKGAIEIRGDIVHSDFADDWEDQGR